MLPGLLEEAGFDPPALVAAQARPDPDFPTAPFPNPEEPGVLDLALADAERLEADLVLANDPDADRLAVAVPDRGRGRAYRVLSGDELGVLIADHLMATTDRRRPAGGDHGRLFLHALGPGRADRGRLRRDADRVQMDRPGGPASGPGHRLLFGYEEALGYAVSTAVADKDGLSAAARGGRHGRPGEARRSLAPRPAGRARGSSLACTPRPKWSLRLPGSDAPDGHGLLMAHWRAAPPERLAGLEVTGVRDLARGRRRAPPSDVLVLRLGGAGRVVLRPSGTEPKLKVYLEATTGPVRPEDLAEARQGGAGPPRGTPPGRCAPRLAAVAG